MAGQMPQQALDTLAREQGGLAAGVPDGVAQTGAAVPDVPLLDVHGAPTSLYSAMGERPSVVILYRGAWCPFCNIALRTYQDELLPALVERGVGLVAVSPQVPDGSLSMQQKNDLEYAVVSDPGNTLARGWGVLTAPSDEVAAFQRGIGLDLHEVNADGTTALPMPTVAIVDTARTLRWIDVHPDYTTRTEPAEITTALDELEFSPRGE